MDGVTEEVIGATQVTGDQDGDIQGIGDIQATGDLVTDTTITHITTAEEVQLLIMETEVMLITETIIQTEATTQAEITAQTETTTEEATPQTDKMVFLTLEEVLLQGEEHTIRPAQLLQTEEEVRDKAIVTTILTEDQAELQPEAMTVVILQETTLPAHRVR